MATDIEVLKARLQKLDKEREAILNLLAVWGESPEVSESSTSVVQPTNKSYTIRGRIVDAVIELIHTKHKAVTNDEIAQYVEQKGLTLGNTSDKVKALGVILSQECEKKSARIKRVARGTYDIK